MSAVFASLTALPRWSALVSFASVAAVIIAVPGPSVLFVIGRAVSVGRRAAVVTVWGNAVGVFLQVLAVAAGIGAIVERSATVFTLVKTVGALYLMWLGVSAIRHRRGAEPQNEPVDDAACSDSAQADAGLADAGMAGAGVRAATPRRWFRDGVVVGAANPKSIVFFTAILPQFVDRHGPVPVQMAVLGGTDRHGTTWPSHTSVVYQTKPSVERPQIAAHTSRRRNVSAYPTAQAGTSISP